MMMTKAFSRKITSQQLVKHSKSCSSESNGSLRNKWSKLRLTTRTALKPRLKRSRWSTREISIK